MPGKILRFDTLPSTQDYALELARNSQDREWVAVVAGSQTKGRGTAGAQWYSPAGQNLYFSLVIRPPDTMLAQVPYQSTVCPRRPMSDTAVINHVAALAVVGVLSGYGLAARIKWPNDVQIGGKKICGILSSAGSDLRGDGFVVCGVGLNVNTEEFPLGLSEHATSMRIVTERVVDKDKLLLELLAALKARFRLLFESGFGGQMREYVPLMAQLGGTYTDGAGTVVGKIEGISEKGWLLVRCADGVKAVCPHNRNAVGANP